MKFWSAGVVGRTFILGLLSWLALAAQAQAQPDLIVTTPISCPSSVSAGGGYALSATIRNQGTTGAQFGFIGAYLSRDNAWDATDAYLNSSGTTLLGGTNSATLTINVTIPATTTAGSYYMVFVADPLNMERESNEQNNVLAVPVSVTVSGPAQLPDLKPWRPSLNLTSSPPGGQLGAFTFVMNQGVGSATNVEMGYYLSTDTLLSTTDVILGTSPVGNMTPNLMQLASNPVLTIPPSTTPGRYYVLLVADHLNRIAESDETNNSRALAITVTGTATGLKNAAALAPRVYPNPVERSQRLRIEAAGEMPLGAVTVTLRNPLGQEVLRRRVLLANGGGQLDVSGVVPGQYLLAVEGMQGRSSWQRLLVQ